MLTSLLAVVLLTPNDHEWKLVQSGITNGLSGMALIAAREDSAEYLVVHDNKKEGQVRVSVLEMRRARTPKYQSVQWKGETPVDLEALCAFPKSNKLFLAATSKGKVFSVDFDPAAMTATVIDTFELPGATATSEFEALALQVIDGRPVLAWAERGSLPDNAKLFACTTDISLKPIGQVMTFELSVPWPTAKGSRSVSDMKIDSNGTVYITSAADSGDDGPFQSVLTIAGRLSIKDGEAAFQPGEPTRLFWTDQHKIEAFDLLPGRTGGLVFGTDDENLGGSVWTNFWPD